MSPIIPRSDRRIVHAARYLRTLDIDLSAPPTWSRYRSDLVRLGLIASEAVAALTPLGEQVRAYQEQVERALQRILDALRLPDAVQPAARQMTLRSGRFMRVLEQDVEARVLRPLAQEFQIDYWANPPVAQPPRFERKGNLYMLSRQVDFIVPRRLENPVILIEAKEYWGEKGGGSKMSDAVYEAALLGHELREIRAAGGQAWLFMVINGQIQWGKRKGDLKKLIDLVALGLLDDLFVPPDLQAGGRMGEALREAIQEADRQGVLRAPGSPPWGI